MQDGQADNVETLCAAWRAGFAGGVLPGFVRRELEGYLDCGLHYRGFARLKCESCGEQRLVAFACKSHGICSSCLGRLLARPLPEALAALAQPTS